MLGFAAGHALRDTADGTRGALVSLATVAVVSGLMYRARMT